MNKIVTALLMVLCNAYAQAQVNTSSIILCGVIKIEDTGMATDDYAIKPTIPVDERYEYVRIPGAQGFRASIVAAAILYDLKNGEFYCIEGSIDRSDGSPQPYLNPVRAYKVSETFGE